MSTNRRFIVGNSVIVGLVLLAGLGIVRAQPRPDTAITEDANTALHKTAGLEGSAILLETDQGRVTLRGSVRGDKEKARAGKAVEGVAGVTEVQNLLQVGPGAPFATETLTSSLTAVHPFTRLGLSTPILDLPPSGEPDPATIADDEIRRNVERALLDLDPQKNADVRVLVSQGVVFLVGTVPNWDGNNDRLHAARSVPGVRSILSELVVAGEDPAR